MKYWKVFISVLLFLTAIAVIACKNAGQQSNWQSTGSQVHPPEEVPFLVKKIKEISGSPLRREIFIYLEPAYFKPRPLRNIFGKFAFADEYKALEWLDITIFSDEAMLERAIRFVPPPVKAIKTKNHKETGEPAPNGYYRARYVRILRYGTGGYNYMEQHCSYSPDPEAKMVNMWMPDKPIVYSGKVNTDFLIAAEDADIENVKSLLAQGADVNARDENSNTALMRAIISTRDIDTVKLLLEVGADVNAKNTGNHRLFKDNTALIYAAAHSETDILIALLEKGADMNAQNYDQFSALLMAAANGQTNNVKALLAKGADTELTNRNGKTALVEASENGYTDVVKVLRAHKLKTRATGQ